MPKVVPRASPEYIAWARSWHRADARWTRVDNRLRRCLSMGSLEPVSRGPRLHASARVWKVAALYWREEATTHLSDATRLHRLLAHPARPYSAASWWPLALHVGWPAVARGTWIRVVTLESHGQPGDVNRRSGATGLLQICPGGRKFLDPETNLRAGLTKFIAAHYTWAPWAATAH